MTQFKVKDLSNYVSIVDSQKKKIEIEEKHKYKILVYFPDSDYKLLNEVVFDKMQEYVNRFKKELPSDLIQTNIYYTLIIMYDTYTYENYISYVFNIEYYMGGAHPNHEIWTVTYDKESNEIIDITDLIKKNSDILNIFSTVSREELLHNSGIVNSTIMMEGTRPIAQNFSNFAFSPTGLLLFFPQYQVAPYSSGQFIVKVDYDKLF